MNIQLPPDLAAHSNEAPRIRADVPGPVGRSMVDDLAQYECPAITARRARRAQESGVDHDPIVWDRAQGANVWDVDGNRYVDLSGAFAVAGVGHAHPKVVKAGAEQLARLPHAMGDVFPSPLRIRLCRRLAQLTPGDLSQSILAQSGSAAVEAALKTAVMATSKSGIIAFEGGYHGLSYGALAVTGYKDTFRAPFAAQLNPRVVHAPYPGEDCPLGAGEASAHACLEHVEALISGSKDIGAVLFEPILGRGGKVVPPVTFVRGLRTICDRHGVVLIADEIFTGFGRTGRWFGIEHFGVVPDLMCLGKGLGGGAPISAAIGRPHIMNAWGLSRGEALHTSTFLGNPVGCAMALATLDVIEDEHLVTRSATLGTALRADLESMRRRHPRRIGPIRGMGLMVGVPLLKPNAEPDAEGALGMMRSLLAKGYIVLPAGIHGHILGLSPPFVISRRLLRDALAVLESLL